jgi:hypothetical protein
VSRDVHFFTFVSPLDRIVTLGRFDRLASGLIASVVAWRDGVMLGGLRDSAELMPPSEPRWDPLVKEPLETPTLTARAAHGEFGWEMVATGWPEVLRFVPRDLRAGDPEPDAPSEGAVYLMHSCDVTLLGQEPPTRGAGIHGYRFGDSPVGGEWHWLFGTDEDSSTVINLYRTTSRSGRRVTGGWVRRGDEVSAVLEIDRIGPARVREEIKHTVVVKLHDATLRIAVEVGAQALLASPYQGESYNVTQQPVVITIDGRPGYGVDEIVSQT